MLKNNPNLTSSYLIKEEMQKFSAKQTYIVITLTKPFF